MPPSRTDIPASSRRSSALFLSLLLPALVIGAGLASGAEQRRATPDPLTYANEIRPVLQQYCAGCHGAQNPSGGVNLARFVTLPAIQRDQGTWRKVLRQLRERSMPP